MKYRYSISEQELTESFGELFEIDQYSENEQLDLRRGNQDKSIDVYINNLQQAQILFDYISTDKRGWDREPYLCIHFPNKDNIVIHGRGNLEHYDLGLLDYNDTVIVDSHFIREMKRRGTNDKSDTDLVKHISALESMLEVRNNELSILREYMDSVEYNKLINNDM